MNSNRLSRAAGWILAAIACAPAVSRADDTNFRPYLLGGRAAGMGGAFTALADDGSGAYYNPGGLAFAARSSVSLSGSVYGVVRGTYEGVLVDAAGHSQDFNYSALNVFPTATAAIRKLGPDDTVHVEVLVPDAFRVDERQSIIATTNMFAFSQQSQTLWIGGGWAHRFGRVGVGAGLHALVGSSISQLEFTVINAQDPGRFASVSSREDVSTFGFVGSLGVRVDATDELRFGASLFLPAVGWGSRKEFVQLLLGRDVGTAGNPPTSVVHTSSELSATPSTPLRVQLGAAYARDRLTLAADLIILGPRDVTDDPDQASIGLSRHIVRNAAVNFSIGGEYKLEEHIPLRFGFFTDFAASRSPEEIGAGDTPTNTLHVSRYGLTASAGYKTEHVSTDLGLNLAYGSGTEYLPVQLDFTNVKPMGASQLFAYLFLATSYEF